MPIYKELDAALAGLKFGTDHVVISGAASAPIDFGAPFFKDAGDGDLLRPFVKDESIVSFSADFVASNSIAANVNGLSITPVVFATSHAATFAALVAAIDGLAGVDIVSSDAVARRIRIRTKGTTLTAVVAVTLGASQPVVSQQASTSYILRGVTLRTQKNIVNGVARYETTDPVNGCTRGEVYVQTADAVASEKQAYITAAGLFTDEVAGNLPTPYFFRSSTSGAGLARVEVLTTPAAV